MTAVVQRNREATPAPAPVDPEEVERFAGEVFGAALGAVELVNVALGLRLGLYEALATGPSTPVDLAARAGIGRRHAREWLEQQAAGTGAVLRPGVVRRYAAAAGFASVQELPVDHAQFRLYRLDG